MPPLGMIDARAWAGIATAVIAVIGGPAGVVYAARQTRRTNDLKLQVDTALANRTANREDGALTLEVADRWKADNVALRDEIGVMRAEMKSLRDENAGLREKVERLEDDNAALHRENARLERRLEQLEHQSGPPLAEG